MEKNNENTSVSKFDWRLLLEQITRWRIVLIVIVILGIIAGFLYTKKTYVVEYSSTATLFVHDTAKEVSSSQLNVATRLSQDYVRIIKSRTVLNKVINGLDLQGWSTGSLRRCIVMTIDEETPRIIDLRVRTQNAELSQKIAREICIVAQKSIAEIMASESTDAASTVDYKIDIIDEAGSAVPTTSPMKKNLEYALLLGIAIDAVWLMIVYRVDDKIKGESDVRRYLGISVLAEIPYSETKHGNTAHNKSKRRTNRT